MSDQEVSLICEKHKNNLAVMKSVNKEKYDFIQNHGGLPKYMDDSMVLRSNIADMLLSLTESRKFSKFYRENLTDIFITLRAAYRFCNEFGYRFTDHTMEVKAFNRAEETLRRYNGK